MASLPIVADTSGTPTGPPGAESLHAAARIEDVVGRRIAALLRRRGWRPRAMCYTGYGGPGWARVLGRVLLSPPPPGGEEAQLPQAPGRGWRSFLSRPVPRCEVEVRIGEESHRLTTDRSGYVDAVVPVDLPAGWHPVSLSVDGDAAVAGDVRIVGAQTSYGVISDIDDTVMVTLLPRPLLAAWNTFVLREHARRPVPGMADLLRSMSSAHPDVLVVYLSTGAWNVAHTLARFLTRHGYPPGPFLLTDWGPTRTGWFRDGVGWVLVGDDGQHDPEIYRTFVGERPAAVRAVAIRHLSATQQVLAGSVPSEEEAPQELASAEGAAAPWVTGRDGGELRERLRVRGIL